MGLFMEYLHDLFNMHEQTISVSQQIQMLLLSYTKEKVAKVKYKKSRNVHLLKVS